MDVDRVADIIEEVFNAAVENCEFDQIVGAEDPSVDISEQSHRAAQKLADLGLLSG